jgi:uncharacterized protein (DUF1919 family)
LLLLLEDLDFGTKLLRLFLIIVGGGFIYDYFGLKYQTPTIGLFFSASDYLKFLTHLDYYLSLDLHQLPPTKECKINGCLGDLSIHFAHYSTFDDAKMKWNKRKLRINKNNLLVKFNDQNGFTEEDFISFQNLPYGHKLFFTVNEKMNSKFTVVFPKKEGKQFVKDDIKPSLKYCKIKTILNDMI